MDGSEMGVVMTDAEFNALKTMLEVSHNRHERLQKLYSKETGRRWYPPVYLDEENYDCPIHGPHDGPDCPRC